jgi:hypothetical protein
MKPARTSSARRAIQGPLLPSFARATAALLAVAVGALASCASLSGGARDTFAQLTTCPTDRVTVVSAPDSLRPTLPPEPSPPPEVAADAARLAVWHQEQEAKRRYLDRPCSEFGAVDTFEATGCGQRLVLCCAHPTSESGKSSYSNEVFCMHPWAPEPLAATPQPSVSSP